jgi:hypothetical protein
MEVFKIIGKKVERVNPNPFITEIEIQKIVENNTNAFFELEYICSEFAVGNYRLDTLCYDIQSNSFVIIEYKRGSSYSVIDQGYTYLQLLLNNKSTFLLRYAQHFGKVPSIQDVDWSQSRIIFISQSFNAFQKDSVNFKNLPFELWEITKYSEDTLVLNKHHSSSNESIENLSSPKKQTIINSVNKEIKVVDEGFHTSKTEKELLEKWEEIKKRLNELDNVDISSKKDYILLGLNKKAIAFLHFRKSNINIDILRGNINHDGSTSKNYFNFDDPKGIAEEVPWGSRGTSKALGYRIQFNKYTDIDYLMFLLNQKYKNLIER